jgi:hypothetical protein
MLRHKVKANRRDSSRCRVILAQESRDATRIEKIKALFAFGVKISPKANSARVDSAMEKAYEAARAEIKRSDEMRVARNRRRRHRA